MEAQRSKKFNEFYRSTSEHLVNICGQECFDKVLYHINSQILKCKMKNVITMIQEDEREVNNYSPSFQLHGDVIIIVLP
jgi:hypothetical protein